MKSLLLVGILIHSVVMAEDIPKDVSEKSVTALEPKSFFQVAFSYMSLIFDTVTDRYIEVAENCTEFLKDSKPGHARAYCLAKSAVEGARKGIGLGPELADGELKLLEDKLVLAQDQLLEYLLQVITEEEAEKEATEEEINLAFTWLNSPDDSEIKTRRRVIETMEKKIETEIEKILERMGKHTEKARRISISELRGDRVSPYKDRSSVDDPIAGFILDTVENQYTQIGVNCLKTTIYDYEKLPSEERERAYCLARLAVEAVEEEFILFPLEENNRFEWKTVRRPIVPFISVTERVRVRVPNQVQPVQNKYLLEKEVTCSEALKYNLLTSEREKDYCVKKVAAEDELILAQDQLLEDLFQKLVGTREEIRSMVISVLTDSELKERRDFIQSIEKKIAEKRDATQTTERERVEEHDDSL